MPEYEKLGFEPPAPVALAVVLGPARACDDVPFLIDTGADVSVIPRWAAQVVGADLLPDGVALRFFDDSEATCGVVRARVRILRYTFDGAFVVADGEHGILGRNILNQLKLTLDGPSQQWTA